MQNRHFVRQIVTFAAALWLIGCSDDVTPSLDVGGGQDAGDTSEGDADVSPDAGEDTSSDTPGDTVDPDGGGDVVDRDTDPDTDPDAGDVDPDVDPDAGDVNPDAGDVDPDTDPDAGDVDPDVDPDADPDTDPDAGDVDPDVDPDVPVDCTRYDEERRCDVVGERLCDGDFTLRACVENDEGCLLYEETACEGACLDGLCVDRCAIEDTCPSATYCSPSGQLVECAVNELGCLVETSRSNCEFTCEGSACVVDPCVNSCDPDTDTTRCRDGRYKESCNRDEELDCDRWFIEQCDIVEGWSCIEPSDDTPYCGESPCGDGLPDGFLGEECDDGNNIPGDGCSATCTVEPGAICVLDDHGTSVCESADCGDGDVQLLEACDDGDTGSGDGCSATCTVEPGWVCDGDPSNCVRAACGNSTIERGEACDDGNVTPGDGCMPTCAAELPSSAGESLTFTGRIGRGDPFWTRPLESCAAGSGTYRYDHYPLYNPSDKPVELHVEAAFAGDGFIFLMDSTFDPTNPGASCIEGSDNHPTRGTAASLISGVDVPAGETVVVVVSTFAAYDDVGGYTLDVFTAGCGDGTVFGVEVCDDGNLVDGDGCESDCTETPGYTCIDEPSYCHRPGCGGGLVEPFEQCDDGNAIDDDGCTFCVIDVGASCVGTRPSVCTFPTCGDGVVEGLEECDDGARASGDGCDSDCEIEDTYVCVGQPSRCEVSVCGDETVGLGETCDDGNEDANDGCFQCAAELEYPPASLSFSGAITAADPTWVRATESCDGASGETVYYDVVHIANNTGASYYLQATAAFTGGDGFLHLYRDFDPGRPSVRCLAGNDNLSGPTDARLSGFLLSSGDLVTIVISAKSTGAIVPNYSLQLTGLTD